MRSRFFIFSINQYRSTAPRFCYAGTYFLAALASVLPIFVSLHQATAQESTSLDEETAAQTAKKSSKPASLPFKGYGKYFSLIKSTCEAISADGRSTFLVDTAKSLSERDVTCEACRPLMQAITQNCKVLVKKVEKKTATPTPLAADAAAATAPVPTVPPAVAGQREPSALVVDRIVSLFSQIASDPDIAEPTRVALQRLFFTLTDRSRATEAGKEYFDTLQSFIFPLFKSSHQAAGTSAKRAADPAAHEKKLNSLFDQ